MWRAALIQLNQTQVYLLRQTPGGARLVSWRVWVLIFVAPVLFAAAAAYFAFDSANRLSTWTRAEATVVSVYSWPGWSPWTGDTTDYSPLLRYTFTDSDPTEATPGQSSPNWNYAVGSTHQILFNPRTRTNVQLPLFEHLWALPLTLAVIAAVLLIPAGYAAYRVTAWRRAAPGARPGLPEDS